MSKKGGNNQGRFTSDKKVTQISNYGKMEGTLAIVLLIFAGVFILTSLIGFCPLYLPLGINTNKKK